MPSNGLAPIYQDLLIHCAQLAAKGTTNATPLIRDILANVNDLDLLYKCSGKYKNIFDGATNSYDLPTTIKLICPTRWLCLVRSITSVLHQYEAALISLEEMTSVATGETVTKASGLLHHFSDSQTIIALKSAMVIFNLLEELNQSFQSTFRTLSRDTRHYYP